MQLIHQSHQILDKLTYDTLRRIEEAGRTCYKSENNITDTSAESFVRMLISKGHESVLEHKTISVRLVTDRGVTHEIVRHRLASFSQESTRYCNYHSGKHGNQCTFIIPDWAHNIEPGIYNTEWPDDDLDSGIIGSSYNFSGGLPDWFGISNLAEDIWFNHMANTEHDYNMMVQMGMKPQDARSVLPNSLKTEIVVTANIREWRTIFKQRTSNAAHPMMRQLMIPMLKELQSSEIGVLFEDIEYGK